MEYWIGAALALAVSLTASVAGLDRDRAFYPTLTAVIASYYALFAVMGGSSSALAVESLVIAAFLFVAILGFRTNLWLVVMALASHGIFDLIHGHLISNPGAPSWWAAFCFTYDFTAAAYLAWLLGSSRRRATSS
jgi:hypothetical protein